jgi:hypothetical protein
MIPSWVKLLSIPLLTAVLIGMFHLHGQQQFKHGEQAERAQCFARDNEQLASANAKIKSLEEKYRQQEQDAATVIGLISSQYQRELHHVKTDKDRIIADLRGGAYRLRIPVTSAPDTCGSVAPEAAASARRRDGDTRAELSNEAAEFLVGLASEADEVVKQLGACQAVINADRTMGKSDAGN